MAGQRCRIEAERVGLAYTANGRERVVASGEAHGSVEQASMNVREDDLAAGLGVLNDMAEDRVDGPEGKVVRDPFADEQGQASCRYPDRGMAASSESVLKSTGTNATCGGIAESILMMTAFFFPCVAG